MLTVRAPASAGNLGSGFDALSVALDLCNEFRAEPSDQLAIENLGEGADCIAVGPENLVYRAVRGVYSAHGQPPPPLRLSCENRIPLGRGMGSSSSAIAAGLLLGNRLLGDPFSLDDLLALGTEMEGHPDNIVSCMLGGIQVSVVCDGRVLHSQVPTSLPLRAVLFVPDFSIETAEARRLLPRTVALNDAVFNLGRSALLVAALCNGQPELLRTAMEDRLHQPPRSTLFPAMPRLFEAALEAGALAACLSGAGSTILALAIDNVEPVKAAMLDCATRHGVTGSTRIVPIRHDGAEIVEG